MRYTNQRITYCNHLLTYCNKTCACICCVCEV